jgi:hypothetical protein
MPYIIHQEDTNEYIGPFQEMDECYYLIDEVEEIAGTAASLTIHEIADPQEFLADFETKAVNTCV